MQAGEDGRVAHEIRHALGNPVEMRVEAIGVVIEQSRRVVARRTRRGVGMIEELLIHVTKGARAALSPHSSLPYRSLR